MCVSLFTTHVGEDSFNREGREKTLTDSQTHTDSLSKDCPRLQVEDGRRGACVWTFALRGLYDLGYSIELELELELNVSAAVVNRIATSRFSGGLVLFRGAITPVRTTFTTI